MIFAQLGVHDVECLLPAIESFFDEGQQHPILLILSVEEGAYVAVFAQPAKRMGCSGVMCKLPMKRFLYHAQTFIVERTWLKSFDVGTQHERDNPVAERLWQEFTLSPGRCCYDLYSTVIRNVQV
jgi:hypothetical protein